MSGRGRSDVVLVERRRADVANRATNMWPIWPTISAIRSLIVAADRLGAINHTLQTLTAAIASAKASKWPAS